MARSIFVDLTVPIIAHGMEIGEFDIWVEVTPTSFGTIGGYWDPSEPPEWETGDVAFYGPEGEDGKREECELPDALQPFVDAYLETDAAMETICAQIADMDRE